MPLFSDGFESGDFSKWTNNSNINIATDQKHHGTYSAKSNLGGGSESYCTKYLSGRTSVYMRTYVRFDTAPSTNRTLVFLKMFDWEGHFDQVFIKNAGGTVKWGLTYRNNGAYSEVLSTQKTPDINTWYCLEIYVKKSTSVGEVKVYVDGDELTDISQSGLNNDGDGVEYYRLLAYYDGGAWSGNVWWDCVEVADAYIGPEGGQVYEVSVDAVVGASAIHGTQCVFNVAADASVSSQAVHKPETLFNVGKDAVVVSDSAFYVQSMFGVSPEAVVKVLAEVSVLKEGEVKVTRLFLVLGDLAIQIQGD